jgi:hypothetical protein
LKKKKKMKNKKFYKKYINMYLFKPLEFQQVENELPTSHLTEYSLRIENLRIKFDNSPRFNPYKRPEFKIEDKELDQILLNIMKEESEKEMQKKTKKITNLIKKIKKSEKQMSNDIENFKKLILEEQKPQLISNKELEVVEVISCEEYLNVDKINKIDKEFNIEILVAEIQKEENKILKKLEKHNIKRWYEKYTSLKNFIEKNDKLPTRVNQLYKHENLYMWMWRQKEKYYKNELSKALINKLEELKDWTWSYKDEVLQKNQRSKRFQKRI